MIHGIARGGGNLVGLGYGDMSLFRDTFSRKVKNHGYQFLKFWCGSMGTIPGKMQDYGYHFGQILQN